jgi:hypothetical protein
MCVDAVTQGAWVRRAPWTQAAEMPPLTLMA